ncbi:MAG: hypothetical protein AAGH15_06960 [Myxococcota bacterium]
MDGEEWILGALFLGPLVMALVCLVVGILLIASHGKKDEHGQRKTDTWKLVIGGLMLVAALGVGGCYGMLFLGGIH